MSPTRMSVLLFAVLSSCVPPATLTDDAGVEVDGGPTEGVDGGPTDGGGGGAACGNGQVEPGEACDFGEGNSDTIPNRCRTSCVAPACGDGVLDLGEACDDGALNSDSLANACRSTCRAASCGDGAVDQGEACDDGALNSDAVANACRTRCVAPSCGDGVVDAAEACDDGATNSDTAANACRTTCQAASCGDGVVDASEACDDGNASYGDGCASCVAEETCVVTLGLMVDTTSGAVRWALDSLAVDDPTGTFVDGGVLDLGAADTSSLSITAQGVAICGHDVYALLPDSITHAVLAPDGTLSAPHATPFANGLAIACPRGARTLHALRVEGSAVEHHAFPLSADGAMGASQLVATSLPVATSSSMVGLAPRSDGSAWLTSLMLQSSPQGGYAFVAPVDGGYAETFHRVGGGLFPVAVATTDDPFAALQLLVLDPVSSTPSFCYAAVSSSAPTLGALSPTVCAANAGAGALTFSPDGTRLLSTGSSMAGGSADGVSLTWTAAGSLGAPVSDLPTMPRHAVSRDQRWIIGADPTGQQLKLFEYLDPTRTVRDARSGVYVFNLETAGCLP